VAAGRPGPGTPNRVPAGQRRAVDPRVDLGSCNMAAVLGLCHRWSGDPCPAARQPHRLAVLGHWLGHHRELLGQQDGVGGPCRQPGPVVSLGAANPAWHHGLAGNPARVVALPGPAVSDRSAAVAALAPGCLGPRAGARPLSDRPRAHPRPARSPPCRKSPKPSWGGVGRGIPAARPDPRRRRRPGPGPGGPGLAGPAVPSPGARNVSSSSGSPSPSPPSRSSSWA
jgi:hypothetical protein